MKKLLSVLLLVSMAFCFATESKAQITKLVTTATTANSGGISSTLTHADTAYYTLDMTTDLQGVSVYDFKNSGTVGGKWYLVGWTKSSLYPDKLDSLTRTDGNDHKTFTMPIPTQRPYSSYQLIGYQTGAAASSRFEIWTTRRSWQ